MTKEESAIRIIAETFYRSNLGVESNVLATDQFKAVKRKLQEFYASEHKAIFLDEIQRQFQRELLEHREERHGGQTSANCKYEMEAEIMEFYIKQELQSLPTVAHQRFQSSIGHVRNKVFVSYSHADEEYIKDVRRHFKPFLATIDFWDDSKIEAGQKWKEEIRKAINQTKVAIVLASTDFFGSDFIATNELPPLLNAAQEDGAVILTVIVKPCLFEEFPQLNLYQAMNPPSNPVIKMTPAEREELFVNLVRQTKRSLESSG